MSELRAKAPEVALLVAVVVAACRTAAPPGVQRVPDPLSPAPPGAALTSDEATALHRALAAAERGDYAASQRYLSRVPATHPAARLAALEVQFLQGKSVASASLELARDTEGYAAAWWFAGQVARADGRLADALEAARRGEQLDRSQRGAREVAEIEAALVEVTLKQGDEALAAGDPAAAFDKARNALRLVPGAVALRALAVRSALDGGRAREAAEMLPSLPDSPQGTMLKAQVAAALGQWQLAEELFRSLPSGYAGRCEGITRAHVQARLENAPPYLREALDAEPLRRKGLAAILVWELPDLTGKQGGGVPVFEDVVQIPERGDIVTVVRCGLMRGDAVTRRFGPNRLVGPGELEKVLGRLAALDGVPAPRWCAGAAGPDCISLPAVVTGKAVVALVRRVIGGEDECR